MPQTLEAISHAKAAKVPIIIALNKMDKPDANPDRVKTELTEAGVVVEEYGGDTPLVPVSAKSRLGLDDLVDMVLLVADLQDLKANPKRTAIGTIVEARMDKSRGAVATALVQTGTLRVGDVIVVGETFGRVRALENEHGKRIKEAGRNRGRRSSACPRSPRPATSCGSWPTRRPPAPWSRHATPSSRPRAARGAGERRSRTSTSRSRPVRPRSCGSSSRPTCRARSGRSPTRSASSPLTRSSSTSCTRAPARSPTTTSCSPPPRTRSSSGFNTKISDTARRAAETEKVDVRMYDIIYQLTDDIEKALGGLLEPEIVEVVEGRAEVRKLIKVGKTTVIAGSYVTDGRMVKGGARVWRGGKVIVTDKIDSLRRFRDDVREVAAGLRVRHRPGRLPRSRGRRRHRVLHHPVRQPVADELGARRPTSMRALSPADLARARSSALALVLDGAFASSPGIVEMRAAGIHSTDPGAS